MSKIMTISELFGSYILYLKFSDGMTRLFTESIDFVLQKYSQKSSLPVNCSIYFVVSIVI